MSAPTPKPVPDENSSALDRFKVTSKDLKNVGDNSNPRATAAAMPCAVLIYVIIGIPVFLFAIVGAVLANGVMFTGLVGTYTVMEGVNYEWRVHAVQAIKTGNLGAQHAWIEFVNPIEYGYNGLLSISQIGISVWDYSIGFMINLVQIFFDVAVPILKTVIVALWPYFMEALLFAVQMFQMFMQVLISIMQSIAPAAGNSKYQQQAVDTSGGGSAGPVGSSAGAVPGGQTAGGLPLNFINEFRPVSMLFLAIFQEIALAVETIFGAWGLDIVNFLDFFLNIFIKYIGVIVQAFSFLVDILSPSNPIGKLLFTLGNFVFGLGDLIAGQCQLMNGILKAICLFQSIVYNVISSISNAIKIKIPNVPNCNMNSIGNQCQSSSTNTFSAFAAGVGICDATVCSQEVVAIINLLAAQLPTCQQWVANANSTLACMQVTYNYSVTQSQYTGAAPIDAIAKELCFVITVLVNTQCAQALPPFSFSYTDAGNSVCVDDRSGLVPPAEPFNDQCACVYTAPLCNGPCCNQYARHVNGQILFYVGQYTCGQLTTQFPPTFWCQFYTTTAANITASSDYTYSSTWCQAYLSVIQPACAAATPLQTLASIDTASLVNTLSWVACNQTVNQYGVCLRINTTTSSAFVDFQYSLGQTTPDQVFASAPPFGTPLVTIPTAATPINNIVPMDIMKYYCYAFFQYYNSTNPVIQSRPGSPLYVVFNYCTTSIGTELGTFDLQNYTYFKLIQSDGNANPINLASIPAGVQPFQGVFGGGVPTPQNVVPDCTSGMTGYNPQELSYQAQCNGDQQSVVNVAGDQAASTAAPANDALSQSQVNSGSFVHLGGFSPINGTGGNSTTQTVEYEQTVAVTQLTTDFQIQPSSSLTPSTSNYRTNYPTPPANFGSAIYVQYKNTPAGRNLLGVQPPEEVGEETNEPPPEGIITAKSIWGIVNEGLDNLKEGLSKIKVDDPHSTKSIPITELMSERAANRGKARLQRFLKIVQRELANRTSNFATTRKLMATGNPDIDQYVTNFWDTVANTDIPNTGINDYGLDKFLVDQAFKDARVFANNAMNVWVVNVLNLFYGQNFTAADLDEYGLDYAYQGGAGGTPPGPTGRCVNSLQEPLKCCKANTSPYGCCYGIPLLCIPMVPDYFYTQITTSQNINFWLCGEWNSFFKAWQSTIRTILTPILGVSLQLTESSFPPFVNTLLKPFVWPHYTVPPFSVQCMFVNFNYILLGIIILWMLALFFAYQFIAEFAIMMIAYQNTIRSEWRGIETDAAITAMNSD
jgi:hypothetical protein